jgi:hydrogenase expression/formation protein HypD
MELVKEIERIADKKVNFMEVCGTHTVAIFKHGIKDMLPNEVNLLSGPGCPVCVTPSCEIDKAIALAKITDVILLTFGDMMKVPGISGSLEMAKAEGRDIRVVYSSMEAITIAEQNKDKNIIFFGIGFETTSPGIAATLIEANKKNINNFFVFSCFKLIPPAMKALLDSRDTNIHGFICPGHVSTIIGSNPYEFIPKQYHIPCVIAGFEPLDILQAIFMLLNQLNAETPKVEIQYTRSVRVKGNLKAQELLNEVFEPIDSTWRGIGTIPNSGLKIKKKYAQYDANEKFNLPITNYQLPITNCICGDILKGIATPYDCPLFAKKCTPINPIGPCMVSTEGSCAAYYKYAQR